jgi:hypothetical protein
MHPTLEAPAFNSAAQNKIRKIRTVLEPAQIPVITATSTIGGSCRRLPQGLKAVVRSAAVVDWR